MSLSVIQPICVFQKPTVLCLSCWWSCRETLALQSEHGPTLANTQLVSPVVCINSATTQSSLRWAFLTDKRSDRCLDSSPQRQLLHTEGTGCTEYQVSSIPVVHWNCVHNPFCELLFDKCVIATHPGGCRPNSLEFLRYQGGRVGMLEGKGTHIGG